MSLAHEPVDYALTVPSDPQALTVVRAMVEAVCKLAGYDKHVCYEVVVAVHEACSNVIRHAHCGKLELPISLECRVSMAGIEFRLRDEGPPFDFAGVPDLDPAEIRRGGRGVFLIRRLLDDVSCRPRPEGGNELRMFKRARRPSE
jgi:anti-sigma regulatory factor (Ser/Thr protein kinase)